MSEKTSETSVDIKKSAKRTRAFLGALMAVGALTACTHEEAPRPTPTVEVSPTAVATPEITPEPTPEKSHLELAQEYMVSEERNKAIDAQVQEFGKRIQKAAESGKIGVFTTFNPENDKYQNKDKDVSEGWVWYEHNEAMPGINTGILVTVYRAEGGKLDWDKGIQSLHISMPNGNTVAYVAPGDVYAPGMKLEGGYSIQFYNSTKIINGEKGSDRMTRDAGTKQDVENLDAFAGGFVDAALAIEDI